MASISTWSTTAASNNSNPPDGFPENMAPSAVNDAARELMASIRTWYEDAEWINLGYAHTYASGTSFTIAGADYTTEYHVGRRLRAVGSSTGTIYGTITASTFSTNTTVTIAWDSGSLSNESLTVSLGAASGDNSSLPGVEISEDDWTHQGNVTIEGTATVGGSSVATTVTTTRGDLIRRGASADERVALGSDGQVMASDGTDALWEWKGVVNRVDATLETTGSTTSTIPEDDTIPQNTEGTEAITVSITPKSASHVLVIEADLHVSASVASSRTTVALFQDSTADALAAITDLSASANDMAVMRLVHRMTAGTTSETTFKIRYGVNAGTAYLNSAGGSARFGGVLLSRLSVTEIAL